MKYVILLVCSVFLFQSLRAHTIKGKIHGLKDGEMIWLFTSPEGRVEHKWSLSEKVDSTVVRNGQFLFTVPDEDYGKLWLLLTADKSLKFYFNRDEDLFFEGESANFGLLHEKVVGGRENVLLTDIFNILERMSLNPVDRREGVNWLKRHAAEDIAVFAAAYFYVKKKVLRFKDVTEILACVPQSQQQNPFYRTLLEHYNEDKLVQSEKMNDTFEINGYVLGMDTGVAELVTSKEGTLATPEVVDTALIRNGYFTFKGSLPYPKYCNVGIRNTYFPVGFFLEHSSVDINIRLGNGLRGKDGKEEIIRTLNGEVYGSQADEDYKYLLNQNDVDAIEKWVKEHPGSDPVLMCIATTWMDRYSPDLIEKWLKMMDENLEGRVAYQHALRQIAKRRQLVPGAMAPLFNLSSESGSKSALKDFRGKYVLLDFWASWCGPCRAEIPNLKKAWDKYHKKGLEIVSITLDKKDADWRKALKDEQMPWHQLNAAGSDVAQLYNVQGIPHVLLIGPDGKIVGINLRGQALEKKLAEIFK